MHVEHKNKLFEEHVGGNVLELFPYMYHRFQVIVCSTNFHFFFQVHTIAKVHTIAVSCA